MLCFLVVLLANRSLSSFEDEVADHRMLLKQLRDSAPQLRERLNATKQPIVGEVAEAPALGTRLQTHATKSGMGETDLEMTPQPEEQVGSWIRKSVQVRLRRKPLGELANFWALTVNDRAQYRVAITRLNVRRRRHEEDSYDVEMIVSSYTPNTSPSSDGDGAHGRSKATKSRSKSRP